jgi:broad specificity phosphatase PhoE
MARIILVRHGQASFLEPNYDQLCATGERQARLLGEYWASRDVRFCRAWSGPKVRQTQTARLVMEEFRKLGRDFPELETMSELDEYPGEEVMRQGLAQLMESSDEVRRLYQLFQDSGDLGERRKIFQRLFELVVGKWVNGGMKISGVESWPEFCARVNRGLMQLLNGANSKTAVVAFTSGGPIAVALQRAMQLSPSVTLQMTWMSRNASFAEFLCSGPKFTLSSFNATPHLDDESLLTYR